MFVSLATSRAITWSKDEKSRCGNVKIVLAQKCISIHVKN